MNTDRSIQQPRPFRGIKYPRSTVSGKIIVEMGDFVTNDCGQKNCHRQENPNPKRHISAIRDCTIKADTTWGLLIPTLNAATTRDYF